MLRENPKRPEADLDINRPGRDLKPEIPELTLEKSEIQRPLYHLLPDRQKDNVTP